MVLEENQRLRPRRIAAVNSVKEVVDRIKGKNIPNDDQPKSGSLIRKSTKAIAARKKSIIPQEIVDSAEDSSELSEEESSEEEQDVESDVDYNPKRSAPRKSNPSTTAKKSKSITEKNVKSNKKSNQKSLTKRQKANAISSTRRAQGNKEDLQINKDNKLFNSITTNDIDLKQVAIDWVESFQNDSAIALAQFINFIFRLCGSNETIDEIQVEDLDNIVEMLESIQKSFKKQNSISYPLISRAQNFRKLRRSLNHLLEEIFTAAYEADILFSEKMLDSMVEWIGAMTSSSFRAFRHTATLVILMITGQIARLNQQVRKEFEQLSVLRDAEKSNKTNQNRLKSLNEKIRQSNLKRQLFDRYHKELDETVFIHRYRDSDPTIRADCMEQLGIWARICPAQFLSSTYMRYLAWELSDQDANVRLVVVNAINTLYVKHPQSSALESFAERFLPRMVEIATSDVDNSVRVAMINTLVIIDQTYSIEEEGSREELLNHIFDSDNKVRTAVAKLAVQTIQEKIDSDDSDAEKIRFKIAAKLISEIDARVKDNEQVVLQKGFFSNMIKDFAPSRIHLAIDAILDVSKSFCNYSELIELLLLDHSGSTSSRSRQKTAGSPPARNEYRLTTEEETVLVSSLVRLQRKVQANATKQGHNNGNEEDQEDQSIVMTKILIPALPKLFNKYKTEANRIIDVLNLVKEMNLTIYMELQEITAYETLWDQIIDQFLRHAEEEVVSQSVEAIAALISTSAMSSHNANKLHFLQESVIETIRQASPSLSHLMSGNQLANATLHALTLCTLRLRHLMRCIDLSDAFEQGEIEQDDDLWDIILSIAQRFQQGHLVEMASIGNAISILSLHLMWKSNSIIESTNDQSKASQAESLESKRFAFLSLCERILETSTTSTQEEINIVQQQTFRAYLDIHLMFSNFSAMDEKNISENAQAVRKLPSSLNLSCSNASQEILNSFLSIELQKLQTATRELSNDTNDNEIASLSFLQHQHKVASLLSHYIAAIRLGVIDIRHSSTLLSLYNRLGAVFNACLRVLIEAIRELGIHDRQASLASRIIFDTLVKAHVEVANGSESENDFINLAKLLSSCLVIRGPQLVIMNSMNGNTLVKMHEIAIEWCAKQGSDAAEKSLIMIKAMSQLLISIKPREALTIKSSIPQIFAKNHVEISSNDKTWDPLRAYEKRLVTIASKSQSLTSRAPAQQQQRPVNQTTNVRAASQQASEFDQNENLSQSQSRPRPRPRPATQNDEDTIDRLLGGKEDDEIMADVSNVNFDLSQAGNSAFEVSQQISGLENEQFENESNLRRNRDAEIEEEKESDNDNDNRRRSKRTKKA